MRGSFTYGWAEFLLKTSFNNFCLVSKGLMYQTCGLLTKRCQKWGPEWRILDAVVLVSKDFDLDAN